MTDLIRPGGAPHHCNQPDLDLRIRDGAVWRCPSCRRKWVLRVERRSSSSWVGEWRRAHWWTFR